MINGLEGIPGSGKSYEAVVYHVLHSLQKGRLVVTNLALNVDMFAAIDPGYRDLLEVRRVPAPVLGFWDSSAAGRDEPAFKVGVFPDHAFETDGREVRLAPGPGRPPAPDAQVFGGVWDYYHEWKHPVTGHGPLFIIDECHVPLDKSSTNKQVIEWFKLHRHFNADVLLMTQSFRDMEQSIARLVAMLVRCRSADFLGKQGVYIRKVFAGYRGSVISTEERKYLPQYFPLYRSHTQGNSVAESAASDVQPFIVKWKRFTYAWWIGFLILAVWFFWPSDKPGKKAAKGKPAVVASAGAVPALPAASGALARPSALPASAAVPAVVVPVEPTDPEPLQNKGVHLRGSITVGARTGYLFVVSMNGQSVSTYTDADLSRAGYVYRPMGDCMGALEWKGTVRPVSCDLPSVNVVPAVHPKSSVS